MYRNPITMLYILQLYLRLVLSSHSLFICKLTGEMGRGDKSSSFRCASLFSERIRHGIFSINSCHINLASVPKFLAHSVPGRDLCQTALDTSLNLFLNLQGFLTPCPVRGGQLAEFSLDFCDWCRLLTVEENPRSVMEMLYLSSVAFGNTCLFQLKCF